MRDIAAFFALILVLVAVPAEAAATAQYKIRWIQYQSAGILIQLDGFTMNDVDLTVCADPGGPQFWLPETASNYEAIVAGLISAFHAGNEVKLYYFGCGNYSANIEYLGLAAARSFEPAS